MPNGLHGIAYDNGFIWQVTGHQKEGTTGYEGYTPGLVKYDVKTSQVVEVLELVTGYCDVHDVVVYVNFTVLIPASIRDVDR